MSTTFEEYVVEAEQGYHPRRREGRQGQWFYNTLVLVRPDIAYEVLGSSLDPFFDDARLPEFLHFVERAWKECPQVTAPTGPRGLSPTQFDELLAIVDRYAGRRHSRDGQVAAALREVLVRHAEMITTD